VFTIPFTKGHGTENDFVVVADPDGDLDLTTPMVAWLCDRRAGIGGDGLIRVVRARHCVEAESSLALDPGIEWFMDYRNADGSPAQMCGNGVRVFASYLLREGLIDAQQLTPGTHGLAIATRAGVRRVHRRDDGWFSVAMGTWDLVAGPQAARRGHDCTVHVRGLEVAHPGLSLDLGNPHTVVMLAADESLDDLDLGHPPLVDPAPPHGSNVEFLSALDPTDDGVGRLQMRVHERGVGETRSCGTGACASAAAAALWAGPEAPSRWLIDVPGGQVEVALGPGTQVELSGPAVLVADGVLQMPAQLSG
jgi:diaminopimelate epimerase